MDDTTETVEKTEFNFDELSESAKQRAVDDYSRVGLQYDWWESVYDDAIEDGKQRGFEIDDIRFSGFCNQGDGASWTGAVRLGTFLDYHLKEDNPDHARYVVLRELIRDRLIEQVVAIERMSAFYVHANTMVEGDIDATDLYNIMESDDAVVGDDSVITSEDSVLKGASVKQLAKGIDFSVLLDDLQDWVREQVRDYANDIYRKLEKEYDYITGEENFAELAEANDWRFDEDGAIV